MKSFADRIARAAASEEADQMVRMLRVAGLTGAPDAVADTPTTVYASEPGVPPKQSRHIGIWERRTENGKTSFVRRLENMEEWHFWANVGRIEAKGAKLRVLFIGESVARGYLYDPGFTPALALQMILDEQFGKDQVEVIDLARTNLAYEVRELSLAALQLEPDIAIIFAGNNWGAKTSLPTFIDIADVDKAISTDGMAGVKRLCDQYISRTVRSMVSEIASEYKRSGIPLVWIVPEFNLADWREPFTNAPYLPDNQNREWITLIKEARRAFNDGDMVNAEKFASKVVEIDQGTCAAGYYILADCRRLANDTESEKKYLELARDAQTWDSSIMYIPKPSAISQQILREELPKHDCQIVDLPALFKEYLKGEIPGMRIFLDYCHMTTEGIQLAMGAAASCVLRALKGTEQPWYTLVGEHIAPSSEVEAEASFLAAIHDAHRYQGYEMVQHFCARAVKHSPHVAELMLNYIELQVLNKAPLRMSEAELRIFRLGSALVNRYLFPNNDKRLDKLLLTAIVNALEESGIAAQERLEQLYREEHSTRVGETNLLHPYYYLSAGQPHEFEALMWPLARVDYDPRYYRAYWPDSKFVFVGEAGYPVSLSLTCRMPRLSLNEGKIQVECNGKPQVEIAITREWSSWNITVPGEAVYDGVNELEVHWPIPDFRTDEALSEVVINMCQKRYPEYYPIFGEIHSFIASSVAEVAESPHELVEVAVSQAVA
ncbi:MAG TPA: SGNH/GDSL hydrolase family protein [Pyrinomonadaceae bacterium]